MKVLTATTDSQGARANDFAFTIEGELVWIGIVCATDRDNPDGGCGCGRAFSGMSSHRPTTTAKVCDLKLNRTDVVRALAGYYESAGYGAIPLRDVGTEVDDVLEWVSMWEAGTIIERRLDLFQPR